jgi:ADP-ribosylation factor GTPase-activating protein 2/3
MTDFFTKQGGAALLSDADTKKKYSSRQGQLYREELERRVPADAERWVVLALLGWDDVVVSRTLLFPSSHHGQPGHYAALAPPCVRPISEPPPPRKWQIPPPDIRRRRPIDRPPSSLASTPNGSASASASADADDFFSTWDKPPSSSAPSLPVESAYDSRAPAGRRYAHAHTNTRGTAHDEQREHTRRRGFWLGAVHAHRRRCRGQAREREQGQARREEGARRQGLLGYFFVRGGHAQGAGGRARAGRAGARRGCCRGRGRREVAHRRVLFCQCQGRDVHTDTHTTQCGPGRSGQRRKRRVPSWSGSGWA